MLLPQFQARRILWPQSATVIAIANWPSGHIGRPVALMVIVSCIPRHTVDRRGPPTVHQSHHEMTRRAHKACHHCASLLKTPAAGLAVEAPSRPTPTATTAQYPTLYHTQYSTPYLQERCTATPPPPPLPLPQEPMLAAAASLPKPTPSFAQTEAHSRFGTRLFLPIPATAVTRLSAPNPSSERLVRSTPWTEETTRASRVSATRPQPRRVAYLRSLRFLASPLHTLLRR